MSSLIVTTAQQLVEKGKGILAADWGADSVGKRFEKIGILNSEENRFRYRQMLFGASGLGEFISGIIENEETFRQTDGKLEGMLPGVKVDLGLRDFGNGEKITDGMNTLDARLAEHKKMGARFCKWRAVYSVGENLPSRDCVKRNSELLVQYALLCQKYELVPIVEPEVLWEGRHSQEEAQEVMEMQLGKLFELLEDARIKYEGLILKTSMVMAGRDSGDQFDPEKISLATVSVLKKFVSVRVGGIVFLSGGQSAKQATVNLNAISVNKGQVPWPVTFSYERALEEPALFAWAGKDENVDFAQKVLLHRARLNSLASLGEYKEELENEI